MPRLLTTAAVCLALGACAAGRSDRLAVCDGQHRRPANPEGSVLSAAPPAGPGSAAAPGAAASPAAPPARNTELSATYAPCGGRA